jgi:L-lactate dehydrogenase complex protein LldF
MKPSSRAFKQNAHEALADRNLQEALSNLEGGFVQGRRNAVARLPEFDQLRDAGRDIKHHVLENLDVYLEIFEDRVVANGGQVHWCRSPEDARQKVLELCRSIDAKTVTKGKSMIGEEMDLNHFLEGHAVEPIETDFGEYIIQLADERPSHIIAPAIHKTKEQVADLFHEHHRKYGKSLRLEEPRDMLDEAREILRPKYIEADVGITGANFMIAETGSTVIVTNEGNGDLTQTLAKMHIALATPEKIVPTLDDATTLLRILARSATGQEMSVYTTFSSGNKRPDDLDGPASYHVIILDNGRTDMVGGDFNDMLTCIKCGACLMHCPVWTAIGGHAYGWVYPGPMGSVLTPNLIGLEEACHLPNASTFCGRCQEICPQKIPLPRMLRKHRENAFTARLGPPQERLGIALWAWLAKRPALYRLATSLAVGALRLLAGKRGNLKSVPLAGGWTHARNLPTPQGGTFMQQIKAKRRAGGAS